MTTISIDSVGFCAHYSKPGDWAFDFALDLSRRRSVQLNVFHFLSNPYDLNDNAADKMSEEDRAKLAIQREKELRMYYDKRAGDYLDVGFRLCEDQEWTELHRCLVVREFQVLVLGYVEPTAVFGGKPIEEFANAFVCPVVLIGPDNREQVRINSRAALIAENFGIPEGRWSMIEGVPSSR